jgi:hypothetical protein
VKAVTVCQHYAELIARGGDVKPIENRTWSTPYRGPLLIHAGKSRDWLDQDEIAKYGIDAERLVFGAFVATARLVACLKLDSLWPPSYEPLQKHRHANGPWCWILEDVRRLARPVYCRGAQGLWMPEAETLAAVKEAA